MPLEPLRAPPCQQARPSVGRRLGLEPRTFALKRPMKTWKINDLIIRALPIEYIPLQQLATVCPIIGQPNQSRKNCP